MQFHDQGFIGSGDPLKLQFEGEEPDFQSSLPSEVDVLIVGAGPAGQLLGAQLAKFPDITTRIVERKPGRLEQGQADGLQCRTIEIFEAFGFSEKVLKEAYWVNETTFWSPSEDGTGLRRSGRIRDTEEGLSEYPHVILNQARLHDLWLEAMKLSRTRLEPTYSRSVLDIKLPEGDNPIDVTLERTGADGQKQTEHVRAKYLVGCDGARSVVRKALGLQLKGDSQNQAWGVLDALLVTDFPDVRLKTAIHSASEGSILIIPREGGYLCRFYIELDKLKQDERVSSKNITSDVLIEKAKLIFKPYIFDVREVAYWSVYEVGQRLTDHFDDVLKTERESRNPRIFITGDACHTHSAKAGQGMNVSMNDSYNLGWKLAAVLRGRADPKLLHTYSEERQAIAQLLIDFDREMSRMFAARPRGKESQVDGEDSVDPAVFQDFFERQARFMAGVETKYTPGLLTVEESSHQRLATGYKIGTRFQSDKVLRVADAKPVHLGHTMKADGRWRIVLFNDRSHPTSSTSQLAKLCEFLERSLIPKYTPSGVDIDSILDVRAVFQQSRKTFNITDLPSLLLPHKGKLGLQDYEKAFTDEESYGFGFGDIYSTRGVSRDEGCIVVVRPDQYISAVLSLSEDAYRHLEEFFDEFMIQAGR